MRHQKAGRPLGRNSSHRKALFRNMVTSFLRYERVETTEAKAKELRSIADQMISLGKKGDLASRRIAGQYLLDVKVLGHLFSDLGPRFQARPGGYTRLIKTRVRHGDGAPMVIVELTEAKKETAPDVEKVAPKKKADRIEVKDATPQKDS